MRTSVEQKYLETSIATASKEDLIIKIYDVLILSAQQALEKLQYDRSDIETIHRQLLRAQRACCLLMGSLDMKIGGDLAKNLFRIYEFWHHELVLANMQKDVARVERLLPDFKDYRSTWQEAVSQFKVMQRQNIDAMAKQGAGAAGIATFAAVG